MRRLTSPAAALACAALFASPVAGQAKVAVTGPSGGGASASVRAVHAETVVVGKVTEIEKETVEGPAYANAPKDQKASYKIAFLKIEDPLIGARGLTLLRVGFLADAPASITPAADGPPGGGRIARPRPVAVALTVGMEGCFFLDPTARGRLLHLVWKWSAVDQGNDNYEKEPDRAGDREGHRRSGRRSEERERTGRSLPCQALLLRTSRRKKPRSILARGDPGRGGSS